MFLGEFQHTLDPKGRVILPATFRAALKEGLVMTVGLDHCLTIHPAADWHRVVDGLRNLRATDRRERMFARMITSSAHPETPDRQGRITIPVRLRDYASLGRDVTAVGADSRVELWDSGAWETYRDQAMRDFANTEQPFNLGIF
ncbi:MAG: division/cell wall cluster transcriptional repressor MraZ [Egibacteraceae bacterium]